MTCSRCQKNLDPSPERPFGHGWYLFGGQTFCTSCWLDHPLNAQPRQESEDER